MNVIRIPAKNHGRDIPQPLVWLFTSQELIFPWMRFAMRSKRKCLRNSMSLIIMRLTPEQNYMKTVLSNTKRLLAVLLALAMVILAVPNAPTQVLASTLDQKTDAAVEETAVEETADTAEETAADAAAPEEVEADAVAPEEVVADIGQPSEIKIADGNNFPAFSDMLNGVKENDRKD